MRVTKNNLCYQKATLDFEALVGVAFVARGSLIESVTKYLGLLESEPDQSISSIYAERIKQTAEQLLICAETYSTLIGARERRELVIVNKPEVAAEKDEEEE